MTVTPSTEPMPGGERPPGSRALRVVATVVAKVRRVESDDGGRCIRAL